MKKLTLILLSTIISVSLVACGAGSTTNATNTYYSASSNYNYQLVFSESSGTPNGLIIQTIGSVGQPMTLSSTANNIYSFNAGTYNGLLYFNPSESAVIGISVTGTGITPYNDFATNSVSTTLPNGTFNTICDLSNLSPCQISINGNSISISEFNQQGQATALCQDSTINTTPSSTNPALFSFVCGSSGSQQNAGTWYLTPFTLNGVTALMVSQFINNTVGTDNGTDFIAFPQGSSLTPTGNLGYVYSALQSSLGYSSGISTASFTNVGNNYFITNATVGTCTGSGCALTLNSYYNYSQNGYAWFQVYNSQSSSNINYNIVGNSTMGIYMDSYTGFYLP